MTAAATRAILDEDTPEERIVIAARARELRRNPVVPGDFVALVGDTSGEPDTLARLVRIQDRSTLLRRSADDTDPVERVVVANVDQLVIVVAAANPEPRTGFIDRAIVAAFDAGIHPLLCITKADVEDPEPFLENYRHLDIDVIVSRTTDESATGIDARSADGLSARLAGTPVEELREHLAGKVSVVIGHSGVGKSTLVNALTGAAARHRQRQRRHRPRPAHLLLRPGAARRRRPGRHLDHRHPRHPLLRAGPGGPGQHPQRLPRPGPGRRRLRTRLHAQGHRAQLRARRLGGIRGRQARWASPGSPPSAGCWDQDETGRGQGAGHA